MRGATLSVAGGHNRVSAVRRRRWFSAVTAALVVLIGSGAVVVANKHAHAASGDRHFILITTRRGFENQLAWSAEGRLFAPDGTLVCQQGVSECHNTWEVPRFGRDRELWRFTAGEGAKVDVRIQFGTHLLHDEGRPGDRSHCYRISRDAGIEYTGDSLTGGCTPD